MPTVSASRRRRYPEKHASTKRVLNVPNRAPKGSCTTGPGEVRISGRSDTAGPGASATMRARAALLTTHSASNPLSRSDRKAWPVALYRLPPVPASIRLPGSHFRSSVVFAALTSLPQSRKLHAQLRDVLLEPFQAAAKFVAAGCGSRGRATTSDRYLQTFPGPTLPTQFKAFEREPVALLAHPRDYELSFAPTRSIRTAHSKPTRA